MQRRPRIVLAVTGTTRFLVGGMLFVINAPEDTNAVDVVTRKSKDDHAAICARPEIWPSFLFEVDVRVGRIELPATTLSV